MALDDQKHMSRRSLELWASGNDDAPDDVFATDYINHQEPDAEAS